MPQSGPHRAPFLLPSLGERKIAGRNRDSAGRLELPPFEDHSSILTALNQVVHSLTHGLIRDELAGRLLYAIQLAQNSISHAREIDPADMVTDYLEDRYGDIAVPAESNPESGDEAASESSTTGDLAPLPDAAPDPERSEGEAEGSARSEGEAEGSAVAFPAPGPADERSEEPSLAPADPGVAGPEAEPRPGADERSVEPNPAPTDPVVACPNAEPRPEGTRDNSPGRQSRDRVPNSEAEVPEGRPNPNPQRPGPAKSGPAKPGPWDNPLLDHIVHQLQSGMSEREVATQIARDLRSANPPAHAQAAAPLARRSLAPRLSVRKRSHHLE